MSTKPTAPAPKPNNWPSILGHAVFVLMAAFLMSAVVYTIGVSGAAWSGKMFAIVIVIMLIAGALITAVGKLPSVLWRALIVWAATIIVYIIIVSWAVASDTGGNAHPAIGWFTAQFWTEFHMVLWWALISLLPFAVGVVAVWLIRRRRVQQARLPAGH